MGAEMNKCPTCGKSLSQKVIMLPANMIEILKTYDPQTNYLLCNRCGGDKLKNTVSKIDITSHQKKIEILQKNIPIVSAQSPIHWDYNVIGIVTAQSVIGTGALSEFLATIADIFGQNSPAFVKKIRQGEESGFTQLIQKTIQLGGNAVISVDIDYSELGSLKGMIMVCMTGTAIKLKNVEVLGFERKNAIELLQKEIEKLIRANKLIAEFWKFKMDYL